MRTSSGPIQGVSTLKWKHWVLAERTWFRHRDILNGQLEIRPLIADYAGLACLWYFFCHDDVTTGYTYWGFLNERYGAYEGSVLEVHERTNEGCPIEA